MVIPFVKLFVGDCKEGVNFLKRYRAQKPIFYGHGTRHLAVVKAERNVALCRNLVQKLNNDLGVITLDSICEAEQ